MSQAAELRCRRCLEVIGREVRREDGSEVLDLGPVVVYAARGWHLCPDGEMAEFEYKGSKSLKQGARRSGER